MRTVLLKPPSSTTLNKVVTIPPIVIQKIDSLQKRDIFAFLPRILHRKFYIWSLIRNPSPLYVELEAATDISVCVSRLVIDK